MGLPVLVLLPAAGPPLAPLLLLLPGVPLLALGAGCAAAVVVVAEAFGVVSPRWAPCARFVSR